MPRILLQVTNERVLARVARDLDEGHTFPAIQRLTTLVQSQPHDLDLRARLAAVHLRTGNWVEAGRWSYLAEKRDEHAVAAFERAYPDPRARLHALRWGSPAEAPPGVRERLDQLADAARRHRRASPGPGHQPPARRRRGDLVCALLVAVDLALCVTGLVALVGWMS